MSLSFHEVLSELHSSALILLPSVSESVSDEPRYRAAIPAKNNFLNNFIFVTLKTIFLQLDIFFLKYSKMIPTAMHDA